MRWRRLRGFGYPGQGKARVGRVVAAEGGEVEWDVWELCLPGLCMAGGLELLHYNDEQVAEVWFLRVSGGACCCSCEHRRLH